MNLYAQINEFDCAKIATLHAQHIMKTIIYIKYLTFVGYTIFWSFVLNRFLYMGANRSLCVDWLMEPLYGLYV